MLSLHLALRWLVRRRAAWLAFGAVVTTVWISIAVMGVVQGFVEVMNRQIRANESDLTMTPSFGMEGLEDSPGYRAFLADLPGVAGLAPSIGGYAMVTPLRPARGSPLDESFPALFDGIDWDADTAIGRIPATTLHRAPVVDLKAPPLVAEQRGTGFLTPVWREHLALRCGSLLGVMPLPPPPIATPTPGAVVGQELAFLNGLLPGNGSRAGSRLHLTIPNGRGGLVGKVEVEVSDTIGTGIYEVDRLNTLIPLPLARRLAGYHAVPGQPALVTAYRIDSAEHDLAAHARRLEQETAVRVDPWNERRRHLVKGAIQQRNILGLVMILIQCLAVFILYASFSTLVVEKRRDIGVLKGLGAQRATIARAFIAAAAACCLVGGLVGWALGWITLAVLNPVSTYFGIALFPEEFFYSPEAPISFDPLVPLVYLSAMTGIGLLAALIPAIRASGVDPVVTLREGA